MARDEIKIKEISASLHNNFTRVLFQVLQSSDKRQDSKVLKRKKILQKGTLLPRK